MIKISLDPSDQLWATDVGKDRWDYVIEHGLRARFPNATRADHDDGCGGELAFCRALGLPWPASNKTFTSEPDVYPNWEIRTLRRMPGIKVVKTDPDDRLVVWVRGKLPNFDVMGYIRAGGAKQHREWYRDPGKKGRSIWLVPPARMIEISPGFHDLHAYMRDDWGMWVCAHCTEDVDVPS